MHGTQPGGGADTAALLARLASAFASYQRALPALIDLVELRRRAGESTPEWRARITERLSRHERELAALEQMLMRAADAPWRVYRPLLEATPDLIARLGGCDSAVALTRDLWSLWWRAAGFPDGAESAARLREGARRLRRLTLSLLVLTRLGRRFARAALARFAAEIAGPGTEAIEPERLHDRWVEACEAAYAELVFTPRYSRAFGRVVNASVGARASTASALEPFLAAAGVPTRAEFLQLVASQHALATILDARSANTIAAVAPPPEQAPRARTAVPRPRRARRAPSVPAKRPRDKTARKAASPWDIAGLEPPSSDE